MHERKGNGVSRTVLPEWPPDDLAPEACSPQLRKDVLSLVPYFAGLSGEELDHLQTIFGAKHMAAGATLIGMGEPAENLFVIASGRVKLTLPTAAGSEHLLDILGPGDSFGALPLLGQTHNENAAIAVTGGCLLVISATDFGRLLTELPSVAVATLEDVSGRLRAAHGRLKEAASAPVDVRLASSLLTLSGRFGEEGPAGRTLGVPLSQEELAALTGSTIETVNRVLAAWRKEGWVKTGRLKLTLLNVAALERVALNQAGQ